MLTLAVTAPSHRKANLASKVINQEVRFDY
jgi:hypothetical protein